MPHQVEKQSPHTTNKHTNSNTTDRREKEVKRTRAPQPPPPTEGKRNSFIYIYIFIQYIYSSRRNAASHTQTYTHTTKLTTLNRYNLAVVDTLQNGYVNSCKNRVTSCRLADRINAIHFYRVLTAKLGFLHRLCVIDSAMFRTPTLLQFVLELQDTTLCAP